MTAIRNEMASGVRRGAGRVRAFALDVAGGPARARVVLILAATLGLSGADTGTISAVTDNLEQAFHIGNTQIGILLSVVALVGAVFTIPVGILTDRTRRTRLLAASITLWAAATFMSGAAQSYIWLLVARVALGAVTATAGPTVASLTGDFFPAADRGRMYGLILGGDLVGSGIGYVVSGDISTLTSWRVAFWWLTIPSLALAWAVWRLPEPARGGQSRLPAGATHIPGRDEAADGAPDRQASRPAQHTGQQEQAGNGAEDGTGLAELAVKNSGVEPQQDLVLHSDPTNQSVWWAVRYVLRVRTNVVLIVASSLGWFYFAGLRSFAIIFVTGHYGISKPVATSLVVVVGAGALAGVYAGGRFADRLLGRGHMRARVLVPAVCLLALTPILAPAFVTTSVAIALPLLTLGAFLLGAPNPPLDAARLDIMHPRLWGRAEGVRTALRSLGEAGAPLLFGYVSQYIFGGPGSSAVSGAGPGQGTGSETGLEYTFFVFLSALLAAGLLGLLALRTYPRDVATARASVEAIGDSGSARDSDREPGEHAA